MNQKTYTLTEEQVAHGVRIFQKAYENYIEYGGNGKELDYIIQNYQNLEWILLQLGINTELIKDEIKTKYEKMA